MTDFDPVILNPVASHIDRLNWKRGFSDGCAFEPCREPLCFMYRAGHQYGLADAIATYGADYSHEWPFPEYPRIRDNVPAPVNPEPVEPEPFDDAPF